METLEKEKQHKEQLRALRKAARDFLDEIAGVPFRAVDCDQDAVDAARDRLAYLSNWKSK